MSMSMRFGKVVLLIASIFMPVQPILANTVAVAAVKSKKSRFEVLKRNLARDGKRLLGSVQELIAGDIPFEGVKTKMEDLVRAAYHNGPHLQGGQSDFIGQIEWNELLLSDITHYLQAGTLTAVGPLAMQSLIQHYDRTHMHAMQRNIKFLAENDEAFQKAEALLHTFAAHERSLLMYWDPNRDVKAGSNAHLFARIKELNLHDIINYDTTVTFLDPRFQVPNPFHYIVSKPTEGATEPQSSKGRSLAASLRIYFKLLHFVYAIGVSGNLHNSIKDFVIGSGNFGNPFDNFMREMWGALRVTALAFSRTEISTLIERDFNDLKEKRRGFSENLKACNISGAEYEKQMKNWEQDAAYMLQKRITLNQAFRDCSIRDAYNLTKFGPANFIEHNDMAKLYDTLSSDSITESIIFKMGVGLIVSLLMIKLRLYCADSDKSISSEVCTRDIQGVKKIAISGPGKVYIKKGLKESIEIKADPSLMLHIHASYNDGVLSIRPRYISNQQEETQELDLLKNEISENESKVTSRELIERDLTESEIRDCKQGIIYIITVKDLKKIVSHNSQSLKMKSRKHLGYRLEHNGSIEYVLSNSNISVNAHGFGPLRIDGYKTPKQSSFQILWSYCRATLASIGSVAHGADKTVRDIFSHDSLNTLLLGLSIGGLITGGAQWAAPGLMTNSIFFGFTLYFEMLSRITHVWTALIGSYRGFYELRGIWNEAHRHAQSVSQALQALSEAHTMCTHYSAGLSGIASSLFEGTFNPAQSNDVKKIMKLARSQELSQESKTNGASLLLHEKLSKVAGEFQSSLFGIAHLDAMYAIAKLVREKRGTSSQLCFVEWLSHSDESAKIDITNGTLVLVPNPIANSIQLGINQENKALLTGPNGAGKSVCIKMLGANAVLAHAFGIASAEHMRMHWLAKIRTCIHPEENLKKGESTLIAQKIRLDQVFSELIYLSKTAGAKGLYLADEPLSGTPDPIAARRMIKHNEPISNLLQICGLVATHNQHLADQQTPGFTDYQVGIKYLDTGIAVPNFKIMPGKADWWFSDTEEARKIQDNLVEYTSLLKERDYFSKTIKEYQEMLATIRKNMESGQYSSQESIIYRSKARRIEQQMLPFVYMWDEVNKKIEAMEKR